MAAGHKESNGKNRWNEDRLYIKAKTRVTLKDGSFILSTFQVIISLSAIGLPLPKSSFSKTFSLYFISRISLTFQKDGVLHTTRRKETECFQR